MTDERRKAAEEWAEDQIPDAIIEGHELFGARRLTDAHLAGQECGEQRAVEKIVRWLRATYVLQTHQLADLPARIERGEWKP